MRVRVPLLTHSPILSAIPGPPCKCDVLLPSLWCPHVHGRLVVRHRHFGTAIGPCCGHSYSRACWSALAPCVQRYYVCAFAVMHVHRSRVPSRVPEGLSVSSGGSKRGSMAESLKATVDHNPSYNGRVAASNGNTLDAQAPGLSADDRNPHGETGDGETGDGLRSTSRTMPRGAGTSTGLEQLHRDSVVAGLCAEDRLHPVLATSLGLSRYCEFTQSQMLQLLANRTVVLLGDSITGRTFAHFVCLVETGAPCDTPCVETRVPSERQGSYLIFV